MTIVVPGSAQRAVGNRWVGRVATFVWFLLLCLGGFLAWKYATDRATFLGYFTNSDKLALARFGLISVGFLWLCLFIDAWRLGSTFRLSFMRAAAITVINVAIIAGVAGSTAYASQLIKVSRETVKTVFKATETTPPLKGRYNILMIGSDARKDRTGIRPDSMTIASIDATTGRTVLVSLPRNLQNVPFAKDSPMRRVYPYGYNCGPTCLLNAVHTAAQNRKDLYPDSADPGLDATIDAVEGATNLKINYYVMINLNGFKGLVNAVGGVEMDVKTRIAMFGHDDSYKQTYIEPGLQKLDGQKALWYARSRVASDDFTRMGRQKCLMAAMLNQLSPQKVLVNATRIAESGKELLSTNIPAVELGQFADLALKSRGSKIAVVSLVPPVVSTVNPNFPAIHTMIQTAIDKSEAAPTTSGPKKKDPTQRAANTTDDLAASC
ncbi:LCP family protein [Aeromicrobium panaciterrae]|uniref:LCP family protein n=1 Tax=Aeromicrobium panaciterrae TaxID=363861 RepID=UPI0031D63328